MWKLLTQRLFEGYGVKESLFLLCSQSMMQYQLYYVSCSAEPQQTRLATCPGWLAQLCELWGWEASSSWSRSGSRVSPGLLSDLHSELLQLPWKCGAGRDSCGEGTGAVPLGSVPSLEGVHGPGSTPALFAFEHQHRHGWERSSLPVRCLLGGWALNDICSLISEVVAGFAMSSLSPVSSAANCSHYLH